MKLLSLQLLSVASTDAAVLVTIKNLPMGMKGNYLLVLVCQYVAVKEVKDLEFYCYGWNECQKYKYVY